VFYLGFAPTLGTFVPLTRYITHMISVLLEVTKAPCNTTGVAIVGLYRRFFVRRTDLFLDRLGGLPFVRVCSYSRVRHDSYELHAFWCGHCEYFALDIHFS